MSQGKMEDVLYDFHIAQAMIMNLHADDRDMSDEYIAAVFQKHGITEAEFDSSLIYYNRHQDAMEEIYNHLQTRYERFDATLQYTTGNHEMRRVYTADGDTAEIWSGTELILLRSNPYSNRHVFALSADTSFRQNDRFNLTAEVGYVREDQTEQEQNMVVCLSVEYDDGSSTSNVRTMSYPGRMDLTVSGTDNKQIVRISGFFYYQTWASTRNFAVIRNISLLRYHTKAHSVGHVEVYNPDSIKIDSISYSTPNGNQPTVIRHRVPALNPDQKRQQNADSLPDAPIKLVPAVRTPNSIGPSRRNRGR